MRAETTALLRCRRATVNAVGCGAATVCGALKQLLLARHLPGAQRLPQRAPPLAESERPSRIYGVPDLAMTRHEAASGAAGRRQAAGTNGRAAPGPPPPDPSRSAGRHGARACPGGGPAAAPRHGNEVSLAPELMPVRVLLVRPHPVERTSPYRTCRVDPPRAGQAVPVHPLFEAIVAMLCRHVAQQKDYSDVGPEIIFTFWARRCPCQVTGCGHRTPIMSSPVMAVKTLMAKHWQHTCGRCAKAFDVEAIETATAGAFFDY